jgi:hypothetical protein
MKYLLKTIALIVAMCLYASVAIGQTPASTMNLGLPNGASNERGMSAANLWSGAQIIYKFKGSGDLADNLLVGARLLYEINLSDDEKDQRFYLPVMGNISDLTAAVTAGATDLEQLDQKGTELLMSSTGATVGLYPYYKIYKGSAASIIVHGVAAWKLNGFPAESGDTTYLSQGRFSIGVEAGIGKTDKGRLPLTVSIAPVLTVVGSGAYQQIFGETKNTIPSLEITGVIPVGQGIGFMIEGVSASHGRSSLRAGLVLAAAIGN